MTGGWLSSHVSCVARLRRRRRGRSLLAGCGSAPRRPPTLPLPGRSAASSNTARPLERRRGVEKTDGPLAPRSTARPGRARGASAGGRRTSAPARGATPRRRGRRRGLAGPDARARRRRRSTRSPRRRSACSTASAPTTACRRSRPIRSSARRRRRTRTTSSRASTSRTPAATARRCSTASAGAGYVPRERRWRLGENLAWGTGVLAAPGAIVRAWMNSPGHRGTSWQPRLPRDRDRDRDRQPVDGGRRGRELREGVRRRSNPPRPPRPSPPPPAGARHAAAQARQAGAEHAPPRSREGARPRREAARPRRAPPEGAHRLRPWTSPGGFATIRTTSARRKGCPWSPPRPRPACSSSPTAPPRPPRCCRPYASAPPAARRASPCWSRPRRTGCTSSSTPRTRAARRRRT